MDFAQTSQGARADGPEELKKNFAEVRHDVENLADHVQTLYSALNHEVTQQARERPLAVLGAAFGLGFILGGGIFSKTIAAAIAAGIRTSLAQALPQMILHNPQLLKDIAVQRRGDGRRSTKDQER